MAELFDLLPVGPVLRTFAQYLIAFCSRPEAASDAMSSSIVGLIAPDKYVKYRDPCLNCSGEIRPNVIIFFSR